jgi:pimeloyl-ACP methyl ester carboxylesterase
LLLRLTMLAVALVATAASVEFALEVRDYARFSSGQQFVSVGPARIRYELRGVGSRGATAVFLSGLGGCVEQTEPMRRALSDQIPSLAYDRAGYCLSRSSSAHSAMEGADELAGLLHALKLEKPVLIVSYSSSAELARVFVGRYPEKVAALYLIDPWMPELGLALPERFAPLRYYGRSSIENFLQSVVGYYRLSHALHNPNQQSLQDQRMEAVVVGRPHNWALLAEWFQRDVTARQALASPLPENLDIEIAFTKQRYPDKEADDAVRNEYAGLAARSSRGRLFEFEHVNHERLMQPSIMFDPMVERIKQLSKEYAPQAILLHAGG